MTDPDMVLVKVTLCVGPDGATSWYTKSRPADPVVHLREARKVETDDGDVVYSAMLLVPVGYAGDLDDDDMVEPEAPEAQ